LGILGSFVAQNTQISGIFPFPLQVEGMGVSTLELLTVRTYCAILTSISHHDHQEEAMNRVIEQPESVGCSSERLKRIKPAMQSYVDQRGYPGLCTMLARHGRLIHFEQVGWQDRENRVPLSADTIYRIYSMTKPIVCTAFMTLYEEGRFDLFDPLAKYLPAFGKVQVLKEGSTPDARQELARPITIRDLLTHTAGLAYGLLNESPVDELYRQADLLDRGELDRGDWTLEKLVNELARMPLAYQPGTKWYYSFSIDVIGHLIQVLSGQPLQDFLKERLFAPLGMADTAFHVPPEKRSRLSAIYVHPENTPDTQTERIDLEKSYPSTNTTTHARGGHGLFSTAWDYMRFAQMLLQRGELDGARILGPKIIDLMYRNHLTPALLASYTADNTANGLGFGLGSRVLMSVAESAMPGSAGEFGWAGGSNTYYWVDPQEEMIGILMAQVLGSHQTPQRTFQILAYAAVME
jgi:CubicO group peptidase (beta-lactamase class C family)